MRGRLLKRDNRYVAYLLFSVAIFILYLFMFNGRSAIIDSFVSVDETGNNANVVVNGTAVPAVGLKGLVGTALLTKAEPVEPFPGFPIDINSATADELTVLPGIGRVTAARIVKARKEAGVFTSVGDLLKVKWIGRVKLESIRSLVTVEQSGGQRD